MTPQIPLPKKIKYEVIFDTNILRSRPINYEIKNLLDEFKKDNRVSLKLNIPEVVKDEFVKYIVERSKSAYAAYNSSAESIFINSRNRVKKATHSEKQTQAYAEKLIKKNKLNIIVTPIASINLSEIINSAVWYKLPFRKVGPKDNSEETGFKDSIIFQTLKHIMPQLLKKSKVVYIGYDDNLRDHTSNFFKGEPNFRTYKKIDDFKSDLKLQLEKVSEFIINELNIQANLIFYDQTNPESLFFKERIVDRIRNEYQSYLVNPSWYSLPGEVNPIAYAVSTPAFKGRFEIKDRPVFIERKRNMYYWQSTIIYRKTNISRGIINTISINIGEFQSQQLIDYISEFDIKWKSKVNRKGKIIKAELADTNITLKNSYQEYSSQDYSIFPSLGSVSSQIPGAVNLNIADQTDYPLVSIGGAVPILNVNKKQTIV